MRSGGRIVSVVAAALALAGVTGGVARADARDSGETFGPAAPMTVRESAQLAEPSAQVRAIESPAAARRGSNPESSMPLGVPRSAKAGAATTAGAGPATAVSSNLGLMRTVLACGVVVGLAVVAAWGVRKAAGSSGSLMATLGAGGRAPSGILSILGRYPVGRGQTLVLLQCDRRVLLLSQCRTRGGASFSTLAEFTDPIEVASLVAKSRDGGGHSAQAQFAAALAGHGALGGAGAGATVSGGVRRVVPPISSATSGAEAVQGRRGASAGYGLAPGAGASPPSHAAHSPDSIIALRRRLGRLRGGEGLVA